jgi:16S rRNA (guanine527-N7)-methyltransferase
MTDRPEPPADPEVPEDPAELDPEELLDEAEEAAAEGESAEEEGEPAAKAKKSDDPDAELKYADLSVPTRKELREAMAWAFDAEEGVSSELLDLYATHAEMVLEGNRRMNLTAIVDPREVAAKHYLDCWRATRLLPLIGRTVLDVGTGAGFPGLPIALAEPNASVMCVDGTTKRIDFVKRCIEELPVPNARAEAVRGEEYLLRNRVELVVMRAVSSVRENVRVLRKVRHSLKDLVMLKGPSWSREARAGEREVERLGFRLDTVWDHELPGDMGKRAILVYRAPGGMGE